MLKAITERVSWAGKVDWELRRFHGEEYSTHHGSSYNSYLVRGEKTALIETVWSPFASEFVENLARAGVLDSIDFLVANHAEPDHSGAMPELLRARPGLPVYCTANGVKSLKGTYHQDWNFQVVKTGDTLDLGAGLALTFVEAPMLHWPDTMFCYLSGENILFSNDAFGQHLACETLFNDTVDECELFQEAIKYYANILTPFSRLVTKKINDVLALKLPVSMICPSHGVIWRKDPLRIVEAYLKWADDYQEDQAVVVYDTMWNATRHMAEGIAQGMRDARPSMTVKCLNAAKADVNDLITEVFKSKAVAVGSPTFNRGILRSVAAVLEEMRGLGFKKKKGAAFGSYGWSGESVKMIEEGLSGAGFELAAPGLKLSWQPDGSGLEQCLAFGRELAGNLG
ncbi:anaerobic nitric oxide reductase flavorubredoxin [Fundidesulfovibrio terrae]|uniref:anaerobic nitric oxide reductase flavorubredoxin n=1 Tax=Fundidesulfovibrio terrae TaxID=2922866 RepID=UPI001FAF3F72|nr:anaerobic nitric oxide reductase flavorubredoxin [Fundidesulfovibrio terrae]